MNLSTFHALLHLGDYDYHCEADKYFTKILDSNRKYQFMGVIGNHDAKHQCPDDAAYRFKENVYNEMMSKSKNSHITCEFSESKFMWACVYQNMRIIGLTPSINGADKTRAQLEFLKKHLSNAKEDWKICAWHFYDKYYHTGKYQQYGNIVSGDGESFYDYCKEHGAIIFSAHDHVYARTRVMSKFSSPAIDQYDGKTDGSIAQIRNGATLNILNGAGGYEMYIEQGEQKDYAHWQKKYAKGSNGENEHKYGGLFCNFNVGGNNKKAYCEFLRINSSNKLFDSFTIYRNDNPGAVSYSQIDENFKIEKLTAYLANNNIDPNVSNAVNPNINNGNMNSNINGSGSNAAKPNERKNNFFTPTNLAIGGCACGALVLLGGAILIMKRSKKEDNMKNQNLVSKKPTSSDYFSNLQQYNNNNMNNNNSYDRSLINDSFMRDVINVVNDQDIYNNNAYNDYPSNYNDYPSNNVRNENINNNIPHCIQHQKQNLRDKDYYNSEKMGTIERKYSHNNNNNARFTESFYSSSRPNVYGNSKYTKYQ